MILHVIAAEYLHDYQIRVAFNDGRVGVADLSNTLHGTLFKQFRVDGELETIAWPNGADLALEYLYFLAFQNEPHLQQIFQTWGYTAQV